MSIVSRLNFWPKRKGKVFFYDRNEIKGALCCGIRVAESFLKFNLMLFLAIVLSRSPNSFILAETFIAFLSSDILPLILCCHHH